MGQTLFDKIWDSHMVMEIPDGPDVLYIDRHLIHEVTSPQAFNALKDKAMKVFRPERTFATCDHNTPTLHQDRPIEDPASAEAVAALAGNTAANGIRYFPLGDPGNGIVHVMGPEQGIVLCGQTVVCGDSHTATHGAFGNIAFGIGTSEVEMVFATQCLMQARPRQARITVDGKLRKGVTPKDVILYIISRLGTGGCTGCFVEYAGEVFRNMSMEGRMTVCNMSIEMGAKGGLVAPDGKALAYGTVRIDFLVPLGVGHSNVHTEAACVEPVGLVGADAFLPEREHGLEADHGRELVRHRPEAPCSRDVRFAVGGAMRIGIFDTDVRNLQDILGCLIRKRDLGRHEFRLLTGILSVLSVLSLTAAAAA